MFATMGEGGMEETGEEDGADGGGWRSPSPEQGQEVLPVLLEEIG